MKDLYRSFTKNYLFRLFALALIATASATASAGVVDFGEMELGKEYTIKDDFNDYQGTFTAPKSGTVYCETPSGQQFMPYADANHSSSVSVSSGNIVGGTFPYSFEATEGTTYYFYTAFAMNGGVFKMEMDKSLAIKESTAVSGSTFSAAGGGSIDITFNQAIALDKITIATGNTSKGVTNYRVNNVFLTIELADILNNWYNDGTLVAGQKFTITVEGLRSSADATSLYNGDGVLELTYYAANAPIKMVSATNADGSYDFTGNNTPSVDFLSYFSDTNANGKYVFTFSAPLDPSKGTISLQYGSSEGGDSEYYQETLTPTFSADYKTMTVDVSGKIRRPQDMVASGTNYGSIVLALNRLTGADGQYVYTDSQGSLGSFYFSFPYKLVSANISSEFTPADSFDDVDSIEIYISGYSSVFFDGIEFSWYENGERQSLVVDKADLKITTDKYDGAEIIVAVPASLKGKSDVTLSLYNLETADGADHTSVLSNVYNASMKIVASTPAEGAELASIKQGSTISVTLNRSDLGLVQYEIYDLNPSDPDDACVATRSTLSAVEGQEGTYAAERYGADLKLYKAHTYRLDVLGWVNEADARGTGYSNPAARASFTFTGSTEPFTFSSVKLVSIDPEEGSILESADQNVFTVTFDGLVTLNSKTTFINRGMGVTEAFENMVPQNVGGEYASSWVLTVPASTMAEISNALTLTIKAYDSGDKLVEGNQGVESGSYFSFEYQVDYNTPDLTFTPASESNVESLSTITVASALGIGQSWDTTAGSISVYKGRDYICDITDIKDGEEVTDENGTKVVTMTLNLPKEITEAGTYQVFVPRGFFLIGEQFSSYKNKAYTLIYTVGGDNSGDSNFNVTTTPADGAIVDSCDSIELIFPGYEDEGIGIGMGYATISKDGGEAVRLPDAQADWTIWNKATQSLGGLAAEDGTYVVSFPEGLFILGDDAINAPAFSITFTVGDAAAKLNITSNPADGATVASCNSVEIIFNDYEELGIASGYPTLTTPSGDAIKLNDAQPDWDIWNKVTQDLGGNAVEDGTYVLSYPEGYFMFGEDGDIASPAFSITFTIGSESSKLNITSSPADGETVASCDSVEIIFNDYEELGLASGYPTLTTPSGDAIKLNDAQPDWDIWNKVTQGLDGNAAEDGTYVLSYPEGYFMFGEDGDIVCPAFSITFTISSETGISNITINSEDAKYYDLNGIEVKNPVNGLYIIKQGNKVTKAIIKK